MSDRPALPLFLGALLVAGFRMAVAWQSPDRIHPVDPAELDLMGVAQAWHEGSLDWAGLVRRLGAAASVHHGGTLPVSLLVLLLSVPLGPTFLALKLGAVLWSTLGWLLWTALALRLGGSRAGLLAGLVLALPPPWALQWGLTAWGSHTEALVLTAAWLLALHARPLVLGLLLGLGAGWDPLLWPTAAAVALAALWQRGPHALAGLLPGVALGWLPLQLGALSTPLPWLRASFTEDPAQTMGGLLRAAADPGRFLATLDRQLPLPLLAVAGRPVHGALNALLGALLLPAGALLLHRGDARTRLLVLLPVLHLLVIALLSPFSATLQHRYLLPWLPAALLWPVLLAARGGRHRAWALPALVPALASLPVVLPLVLRDAPADLGDYRPTAYLALGLDRVDLEQVPEVERFLAARGASATEGFSAGWTRRWGYPVLGEPFGEVEVRGGLRGRLLVLAEERGAPVEPLARDAGWGLGVLLSWEPESCLDAVALLQDQREPALQGLGEGLAGQPGASDFVAAVARRDAQAAAVVAQAAGLAAP